MASISPVGDVIGVDLIRRPGPDGAPVVQVALVDDASGTGVAVDLAQLDEVLALLAGAVRRAAAELTPAGAR
jgi:hypothetical protein